MCLQYELMIYKYNNYLQIHWQRYQAFVDDICTVDYRLDRLDDDNNVGGVKTLRRSGKSVSSFCIFRSTMLLIYLRSTLLISTAVLIVISIMDWAEADWETDRAIRTHFAYVAPSITATLILLQFAVALRMLEHQFGRIVAMADVVLQRQHLQLQNQSRLNQSLLHRQQQQRISNTNDDDGDRHNQHHQQQQLNRHSLTPLLVMGERRPFQQKTVTISTSISWQQQPQQQPTSAAFSSVNHRDPAAYLNALRREHIRITRIFNGVLNIFGFAVVGIVLTSILDMTLQAYLFYKVAVNLDSNSPLYMAYTVIWLILVVGRLFGVVWMCDRVNGAVKNSC